MNYFELYPGDYLRDTGELSLSQHGAYLLLMASYYSTEDGLPVDKVSLFRITRAMTKDEQAATLTVVSRFFKMGDDGRLHSSRIDDDLAKAKARQERARANGGKGGRPPKSKNPDVTQKKPSGFPAGFDNVNPDVTQKKAHQTPDPSKDQEQKQTEASQNATEDPIDVDTPAVTTSAGLACRLMRQAGCTHVSPQNSQLLDALVLGITPQQLADVAAEAVAASKSKPFGWAIATAISRHHAGEPITPQERSDANRSPSVQRSHRSAVERVRAANERAEDADIATRECAVRVIAG